MSLEGAHRRASISFCKLLTIPLLMIQFRRSDRAIWALGGVPGIRHACCSWRPVWSLLSPTRRWLGLAKGYGLPVKDYIAQSAVFIVCAFGLLYLAIDAFRLRWRSFGVRLRRGRRSVSCRHVFRDHQPHRAVDASVSARAARLPAIRLERHGRRLRHWRDCGRGGLGLIAVMCATASAISRWRSSASRPRISTRRPARGSISGSVHSRRSARRRFWVTAPARSAKPSSVARSARAPRRWCRSIRIIRPSRSRSSSGLSEGLLLFAMWIAHFALFFGGAGMASWIGILLVAQNVIGSLANSHLFDFTHGWMYCIGVGVCGGIATRQGAPLCDLHSALQGSHGQAVTEHARPSGASADSGRRAAPARRRPAHDAADPQPAARLAAGHGSTFWFSPTPPRSSTAIRISTMSCTLPPRRNRDREA